MHPSGCSRQGGIFQELPPKLTVTLSSQLKTFPSSRFSAREISPDNAKDRVSIETTRRMENGESKPRGDCSMGDPSSDPYWRISDRMYIREGIYVYIIFGVWKIFESCFEGILNADWIWKLIFFREIVSKNFELKVLENCEFERE